MKWDVKPITRKSSPNFGKVRLTVYKSDGSVKFKKVFASLDDAAYFGDAHAD